MKSAKANSLMGALGLRKKTTEGGSSRAIPLPTSAHVYPQSSPEHAAIDGLVKFCTADAAQSPDDHDAAIYLPSIVEACESSPTACAEVSHLMTQFLGKTFTQRPEVQHKAVMVMRILVDNESVTHFTRNLDKDFTASAKALLRGDKSPDAKVLLVETLDKLDGLFPRGTECPAVLTMWRKERQKDVSGALYGTILQPLYPPPSHMPAHMQAQIQSQIQNQALQSPTTTSSRRLPPAAELSSRLEEALNSATLLSQCVANAEPSELLTSDLIKEFHSRCKRASRSVQKYINATDPAPDNATMETLLDVNEQLQTAISGHQRALLSARRSLGIGEGDSPETGVGEGGVAREAVISPLSDTGHWDVRVETPTAGATAANKGKTRGAGQTSDEAISPVSSVGSDNPFSDRRGRDEYVVEEEDDLYGVTPQKKK